MARKLNLTNAASSQVINKLITRGNSKNLVLNWLVNVSEKDINQVLDNMLVRAKSDQKVAEYFVDKLLLKYTHIFSEDGIKLKSTTLQEVDASMTLVLDELSANNISPEFAEQVIGMLSRKRDFLVSCELAKRMDAIETDMEF